MTPNYALAEKQRQDVEDYVKKQTELAHFFNNLDDSPANYLRQLGRSFSTEEFERKLLQLNKNFRFEQHPNKPEIKWLYILDSRGKTFVCSYSTGKIPEHSVRAYKEEEVIDTSILKQKNVGGVNVPFIDKKDLPKGEYVPGQGWVWDSAVAPGYKMINVPWHEGIRGWRTVLIYIVKDRLASPYDVEKIFGSDDTPEWKKNLSKGYVPKELTIS